jgi:hypothetical protein
LGEAARNRRSMESQAAHEKLADSRRSSDLGREGCAPRGPEADLRTHRATVPEARFRLSKEVRELAANGSNRDRPCGQRGPAQALSPAERPGVSGAHRPYRSAVERSTVPPAICRVRLDRSPSTRRPGCRGG